ncbi:hypothetical protein GOODEAATRI_015675, partial [Goodea atripinnis]
EGWSRHGSPSYASDFGISKNGTSHSAFSTAKTVTYNRSVFCPAWTGGTPLLQTT